MGLSKSDDKIPDRATLIPWMRGKPLAWDNTIPETYANSSIGDMATRAVADDQAASSKMDKYMELAKTHHFTQVAVETSCSWNDLAIEFVTKFRRRITVMRQESRDPVHSSISLLRGKMVAF